jgi:voltage-gated sodium channel
LTNSILIGVETYGNFPMIVLIQNIILGIFTVEVIIRFIAAGSLKKFFFNGWHIFDLTLVAIGYIPETMFENTMAITSLRVLRAFRILRLIRSVPEIQLIIGVLLRSVSTLAYNTLFFLIFLYMFSVLGTYLFKMPIVTQDTQPDIATKVKLYGEIVSQTPEYYQDPYGNLAESAYTLLRITTSDNWSQLRYGLLKAREYELINVPKFAITFFHVAWYVFSAFLLLNLVIGAIVGNYQELMAKYKKPKLGS